MRRLKLLRIMRGLSQQQLAVLVKLDQPEISRIESGRVNPLPGELGVLSRLLNCPPDRLLDHVSAAPLGPGAELQDKQRLDEPVVTGEGHDRHTEGR